MCNAQESAGRERGGGTGKETFSGGSVTLLSSNIPQGLPQKRESFVQLNSDYNAALAEV